MESRKNVFFINIILVLSFLIGNQEQVFSQYDGDQVFDQSIIHEVHISSTSTLQDLVETFFVEFLADYSYALASITIDGNLIDSVGVRVKGGISAFDAKSPLKIDFNEFVSGQKYDGLKKLNLHQGNMDPTFMRETLCYQLLRDSGIKTVRTSYANVYFNGNYKGLYTLVEQVDDNFINSLFASSEGALYKTTGSDLLPKYETDDSFSYEIFKSVFNNLPIDSLHIQLEEYMDVEALLRFFAFQTYINESDGPLTVYNNFYLYYEPKSKKYAYIPWDYNLAFYRNFDHSILMESNNFIFEKIKLNETLRNRYLDTYCTLLQTSLQTDRVLGIVADLRTTLEDLVEDDPFVNSIEDFQMDVDDFEEYIAARASSVMAEIESNVVSCDLVEILIPEMQLVINELVASNDTLSGVADQEGGHADWIELYNNSDQEFLLDKFYLSNDIDFLKHWRFPKDTRIAPNDYLIVWADRDVGDAGLHCDFKLNKEKGSLYLSHENGELIDSISYVDQETNFSLARIPNGTGPFTFAASTFSSTNNPLSIGDIQSADLAFSIYPNPVYVTTTLEIASSVSKNIEVQILAMDGRVLFKSEVQISEGVNQVELDLRNYQSGSYTVVVLDRKSNERSSRILVLEK